MFIIFLAAKKYVKVYKDVYAATASSDAIIVCTEWDEFKYLDYQQIYGSMRKPAFIFDGRLILDIKKLTDIGFHVESIGKSFYTNQLSLFSPVSPTTLKNSLFFDS